MNYLQEIDLLDLFVHLLNADDACQRAILEWDSISEDDPFYDESMVRAESRYYDAVDHYLWVKDEVIRRNAIKLFNDFSYYLYERGMWNGLSKAPVFIQNRNIR